MSIYHELKLEQLENFHVEDILDADVFIKPIQIQLAFRANNSPQNLTSEAASSITKKDFDAAQANLNPFQQYIIRIIVDRISHSGLSTSHIEVSETVLLPLLVEALNHVAGNAQDLASSSGADLSRSNFRSETLLLLDKFRHGRPPFASPPNGSATLPSQEHGPMYFLAVRRLNRLLLEDAFPGSLASMVPPSHSDAVRALRTAIGRTNKKSTAGLPEAVFEGLLITATEQIYLAREEYSSDARHAQTLMTAVVGALAVLVWNPFMFQRQNDIADYATWFLAILLMFGAHKYGNYLKINLNSGYSLYVSACQYVYIIEQALGIRSVHPWANSDRRIGLAKRKFKVSRHPPCSITGYDWINDDGDPFWDEWELEQCPESSEEMTAPQTVGQCVAVVKDMPSNLFQRDRGIIEYLQKACYILGIVAIILPLALIQFQDTRSASRFLVAELPAPRSLIERLQKRQLNIDVWFTEQLSPKTRSYLENVSSQVRDIAQIKKALRQNFNEAIVGSSIYDRTRFSEISLRPETMALIAENPQGERLARLNRLLLEDAYPIEIPKIGDVR